jgi:hypothetical protein
MSGVSPTYTTTVTLAQTAQGLSITGLSATVTQVTAVTFLTGPVGPQGPQGPTGAAGATGATGATGPQGPTGATGATGATGPTGPTGATGPSGTNGTNGTNGATWYSGAGAPSTTHNDGDFYLNTSNGDVYKQVSGAWGSPIENITGPTGPTGSGNVNGPGSSSSGHIATWNNLLGTLLADSGATLPSGAIVGTTDTQTLTNKRLTLRVGTTTSSAAPAINTDNYDVYGLTAQAAAITGFTMSGTPTDGQHLWIYIVPTASWAITWGASFEAGGSALPTTTTGTTRLDVLFVWNAATSKWRCMSTSSGGTGTITGPGSSTDTAIVRWNGTTGTIIEDSTATLDGSGNLTTGTVTASVTGSGTGTPITATMDSSVATNPALLAKNNTNFAQTGPLAKFIMFNATDSGNVVRIENSGTGKNISSANGTTETFSVDKTGAILSGGVAVPTISSTSVLTNKDLTSGTNTFPTFNQNTTGSAAKLTTARTIAGVSFDGTANIPLASTNLSDTASIVLLTSTQTLTNKRVTKRVTTISAPGATPTINTDNYDRVRLTALAAAITSMTTNLSGTPQDGDELWLGFIDNGTARAITWGAKFASSGVATLLATTVTNKQHWVKLEWDSSKSLWICMAVDATGY